MAAWCEARGMKVAVVGAGWAGCAAAVQASRLGFHVTLFEAARTPGGRARRVVIEHEGKPLLLDNGQHILIGAYSQTLKLMADLGLVESDVLLRTALVMQFPDGTGLKLPRLPAPFDAAVGILLSRGWSWRDKTSLLAAATRWQLQKFTCPPQATVAELCSPLTLRVMAHMIEPLCVSALNTPADRASGQVFLRVLRDALFDVAGGSNLLLPKVDLSALLPDAALGWLAKQAADVRLGSRVQHVEKSSPGWRLTSSNADAGPGVNDSDDFEAVILACPAPAAAKLLAGSGGANTANAANAPNADWAALQAWQTAANGLTYEAITTVYAFSRSGPLARPMLALPSSDNCPAQFVFDRGQLGGPPGLLAFVISASTGEPATLASRVVAQAKAQLGLHDLQTVQTIVEKRATFACTPGLVRPGQYIAPGLLAAGDYVDGPYPATLEGAVRSGLQAALLLK